MPQSSLFCPFCREPLLRVSRRQDYFCRECHSVVELRESGMATVQQDFRVPEVVVPVERLKPEPRED